MPAIALCMEEAEGDLMEKPPRPAKQPVVEGQHAVKIAAHAIALASAMIVSYTVGLYVILCGRAPARHVRVGNRKSPANGPYSQIHTFGSFGRGSLPPT